MRRSGWRTVALLSGLLAVALATGIVRAADQTVTIQGSAFSPDTVTVTEGDTVTWTNADAPAHTATGAGFDTERLDPGQRASITFSAAGIFPYVCAIHPQMRGTVVVEAAAAPRPTPTEPPPAASDGGAAPTQAGATPPTTDMLSTTPPRRTDVIGSVAMLLAAVGVSMLVATMWTSRRGRR